MAVVHEVIVGNIGIVYGGENGTSAQRAYGTYVRASKLLSGRAGGEDVTWLKDGDIYREYIAQRDEDTE